MNKDVEYPFKDVDKIFERDSNYPGYELSDLHSELEMVVLNEKVPVEVRQLFDTAKNVALYSFYVYRFHQVAEMVSLSAIEMSLRLKAKEVHPEIFEDKKGRKRHVMFKELIELAISENWVVKEKFTNKNQVAKARLEFKYRAEAIKENNTNYFSLLEPSQEEIHQEVRDMEIVEPILRAALSHRNDLAHGSPMLAPSSLKVIFNAKEIINQLFSDEN